MSQFGSLILTNNGKNLQSKAQSGTVLRFTKIGVGDGRLNGSAIPSLNNLINLKKSLQIQKLKSYPDGKAVVGSVLLNQDIASGFYFRELGVFAQDPDLGEILYCYANAGDLGEYIPAGGGPDVIEKVIDIFTLVGNATNVTAIIDTSVVYETQEGAAEKAEIAKNAAIDWAKSFGMGDVAKDVTGTDLNLLNQTGFYRADRNNEATLNGPSRVSGDHAWVYVLHFKSGESNKKQIAYDFANIARWERVFVNGAWTTWKQLATEDRIKSFGLVDVIRLSNGEDLNTTLNTGFYYGFSGNPNAPINGSYFLNVFRYSSLYTLQIAVSADSNKKTFTRTQINGIWNGWKETSNIGDDVLDRATYKITTPPASFPVGTTVFSVISGDGFPGSSQGTVITHAINTDRSVQYFIEKSGNKRMFFRNGDSALGASNYWSAWSEIVTDGTPTFTNLTLQNGATSASNRPARYTRVGKLVTLEGEISPGIAAGTAIGVLPAGFRPPTTRLFKTALNTATTNDGATIYVTEGGSIVVYALANTSNGISLMGISFYVD
ncbi:phage tail protein [Mesobacillus thioparans]|uniref:phage tail-collar fiber domain-containing protein n=1 Tax=Mesobacillus thioparans TaxID=370439 RepID=UPI0039EF9ADA